MKRALLLTGALLAVLPAAAAAQDRIGYANLDLIIAKMPESQEVARKLDTFQGELAQGLSTKRAYAKQKLVEAQNAQAAGVVSEEKLGEYETELRKLDREIQETAQEADRKMLQRRNELMEPIIEKLQATIEQVAQADGYTHVLNVVDGTGTSVLLWGIDERDLTKRILQALGIPLEGLEETDTQG
jgi:outer membrane protein